jgi:hypothetical protein
VDDESFAAARGGAMRAMHTAVGVFGPSAIEYAHTVPAAILPIESASAAASQITLGELRQSKRSSWEQQ